MEHVNAGSALRQDHHHQQFCLRWHNHQRNYLFLEEIDGVGASQKHCMGWLQTSLLSSLPILLDQSHLTDVTLSAEGRTLRAHRVVLSACSTFFLELFRALDSSNHPVIIIPGASFAAIVALLTFMYSGEVNVFEEQIPTLLNLAETLGIKGLADVQSNLHNSNMAKKRDDCPPQAAAAAAPPPQQMPSQALKDEDLPSPTHTVAPPSSPLMPNKLPTPLENFFLKSLQFYPNLIPQPLNFSQSALNKTSEFLAKYQQQCGLYNSAKDSENFVPPGPQSHNDDGGYNKRTSSGEKKTKDIKRIDKIVENLRCATQPTKLPDNTTTQAAKGFSDIPTRSPSSPLVASQGYASKAVTNFCGAAASAGSAVPKDEQEKPPEKPLMDHSGNAASNRTTPNALGSTGTTATDSAMEKPASSPQPKISNSKLYATCFICHKQLSNQYNLRVHLETHQNVRYACNVCTHVSRSKDALRKHVSYRHPGAPSPCESEARRKRAKGLSSSFSLPTPTEQEQMATQLNPAFMFMPNQFHLTSAPPSQMATPLSVAPTTTTSTTGPTSDTTIVKRETTPTSPTDYQQNSTTFTSDSAATKP